MSNKNSNTEPSIIATDLNIQANSKEEAQQKIDTFIASVKKQAEKLKVKYKLKKIHIQLIDNDDVKELPYVIFIKPIDMTIFKLMANFSKEDSIKAHQAMADNMVLEESNPIWKEDDEIKLEVIKYLAVLSMQKKSTSMTC